MPEDAKRLIRGLLDEDRQTNLFLMALSVEERCLVIPRILAALTPSRTRNRVVCIILPDHHVLPLAAAQRARLKVQFQDVIAPEFLDLADAKLVLGAVSGTATTNIIIDASGMPRRVVFDALDQIGTSRRFFENVFLTYTHPLRYSLGELELVSPRMRMLFPTDRRHSAGKIVLAVFPGFDANETSCAIAQMLDPTRDEYDIRIRWIVACNSGHYWLYERSLGEHQLLMELMEGASKNIKLCRLGDFADVGKCLVEIAADLNDDETLIVVNLGPRIVSVPIYLAVRALKREHKAANILVQERLFYRSVRTEGDGWDLPAWDLRREFERICKMSASVIGGGIPMPDQATHSEGRSPANGE